ncbi:CoA transferase [Alphaproteobacteria bacterium HT1-32]|nr:CoA transferase [Alphaproteobacteria bacterium HT1-32]
MTPMLKGYRVLDITQFVAGPTCTRIMAELGAEVIKVEMAPLGDHGRQSGLKARGADDRDCSQSTYFFQHNHSKKSLALDLKHPRGQEILKELVPKVDVIVENFAPGVIGRMGLGYEELRKLNDRLIMCSISMAGQSGPLASQPGFDYMGAAYAGMTSGIGEPDRGPVQMPVAIGDSATGVAAAMAVGFALLHRERTGEGQYIDCSLLDTYVHMQEDLIPRVGLRGAKAIPPRSGSQHPNGGPTGVFRAGDGRFLSIMVMPYQWKRMVEAMGRPELAADPRFDTPQNRRDNREALKLIIEDWMAGIEGGRDGVLAVLAAARVPSAPVLALDEVIEHPHMRQRGTIREVTDPHLGTFPIPGMPARFSSEQEDRALTAPLLGQHNAEVLSELLNLSDDEIAELHKDKVLVNDRRVR